MKKAILLIIDGLGDLPTPKTPLQAAKKPNLDNLADKGITGMMSPVAKYVVPGSDVAHLNILGYDPAIFYRGRGPLEALGLGIRLKDGDVAFRANFATCQGGTITDRRAGRIDTATAASLSKYLSMKIDDVEVIFKNSAEHRGALVLRGRGLSAQVSTTDAHEGEGLPDCQPLEDTPEARKTADIVNKFTKAALERLSSAPENKSRKLPANAVLLRGAGNFVPAPSFSERFGLYAACVAGGALYKGVASFMGMDVLLVPGATGDRNTNLEAKARAAAKALETYDFVFMHVKLCDSAGHDGDFALKKEGIERIDGIIPMLEKTGACIVVTGDHSTPCSLKAHSGHEVPILVYGGERRDFVEKFDEISCAAGGLGHIKGRHVVPLILNITGRAHKYGS
ncbi:MAG TPA: 2,3-bisphosphoglycerate-independent phosphoglycerate mutase [Candidatus Bilamarchaeum sp.]|nr:2,3-bisphosphoglycerate-independent phosphoglycerate mutase [Candidatus Bilamarchaeum sp.]